MATKTFIPSRFIKNSGEYIPDSDYIIGVCRISTGGGSGTWNYINRNGESVLVSSTYFKNHPIFRNSFINKNTNTYDHEFIVGDNTYIYVPPFFIKNSNTDRYWIAPYIKDQPELIEEYKALGFRLHPAFYFNQHQRIYEDNICGFGIGKYLASYKSRETETTNEEIYYSHTCDDIEKLVRDKDITSMKAYLKDKGVTNYQTHLLNVYEYNALQWLFLIQYKTTDVNWENRSDKYFEDEEDFRNKKCGTQNEYFGVYDLWGSLSQYTEGVKIEDKTINMYVHCAVTKSETPEAPVLYNLDKTTYGLIYTKLQPTKTVTLKNQIYDEYGSIIIRDSECKIEYYEFSPTLFTLDGKKYNGDVWKVKYDTIEKMYYITYLIDNEDYQKAVQNGDENIIEFLEKDAYQIYHSDMLFDSGNNDVVYYNTHLSITIDPTKYYAVDVNDTVIKKPITKNTDSDYVDHYINMGDLFFPTIDDPHSVKYYSGTYSDSISINDTKNLILTSGGNYDSQQDGGLWSYEFKNLNEISKKYGYRLCYQAYGF